jgi:hypothetical protein
MGRIVRCISGSLWLSFDGDPRDVVLAAGQAHRCDRNTPLFVEGLEDAKLRIEMAAISLLMAGRSIIVRSTYRAFGVGLSIAGT